MTRSVIPTQEQCAEIVRLHGTGMTSTEIAFELELAVTPVDRVLIAAGLK